VRTDERMQLSHRRRRSERRQAPPFLGTLVASHNHVAATVPTRPLLQMAALKKKMESRPMKPAN